MSVKLNQKGFTLPEIMVSLGLLGGISIVTVRLIENQANNEAHLKAKAEIAKTTSLLKTILNDPESCRNMLKDQPIPAVWTPSSETFTNIQLPPALPSPSANPALPGTGLYQRIKLPGTSPQQYAYKEILITNAKYGLFRTGSIRLVKTSDANTPTTILNPTAMNIDVDTIELEIQFRLETRSILNALSSDNNDANDKTYLQRIPLIATFDYTNNLIKDCGLVVSEANVAAKQKFCTSLGYLASWDATTQKCNFISNKCPAGQIPEKQNCTLVNGLCTNSSVFTCVPIVDQFKADDLFDTSTTGCIAGAGGFTVVTDPVSLKLKINCN